MYGRCFTRGGQQEPLSSSMDWGRCRFKGAGGGGQGGQGGKGGKGRRGGTKPASAPEGFCVCPSCGHRQEHIPGQRCLDQVCPKCGTKMVRE